MEVVGLVASIPGLIELTTTTLILLRDVSQSRKALSEVTKSLDLQLQALSEVLNLFLSRGHSTFLLSSQRQKLSPLIEQLRQQLESLKTFLSTTRSQSRLQRIKIVVNNPKKKLRDEIQKLETSISILKLYLLECSLTLNEEAAAATLSAKKLELRTLLNPSGHDFIRTKLNGTLNWILSNTIFHQWLTASTPPSPTATPFVSRLLLIHGSKGSGKSVLAASTATDLRLAGRPCAFFSFFHGIERQKKCKSMLSTILWQMLNFDGHSSETFSQAYGTILNSDSMSLELLRQTIEYVASTLQAPFYMVIDGVDESDDWDDTDAEGPLHMFEEWIHKFSTLHILLAGRQPILHHALAKYPGRSIELSGDVTSGDIFRFIDHKIKESPRLNAMPEHVRAHVQKTLREKSTGMFLWVELVFKELHHCHSSNSVTSCLQDLPQDLESEYARLFIRLALRLHSQLDRPIPSVKVARTLLALVMSSLDPLTVDDLRYAYAASCRKGQMWREELIAEDAMFDLIGDFVTCTGSGNTQHVHFCHSSFEEFLLLPPENWTGRLKGVKFFRLDYMECHQLMARACLEYVANFDFGYPLTDNSYQKLISKAFIFYATKNGFSHFMYQSSTDMNNSITQTEVLDAYIKGPNFGGLTEFIVTVSLDQIEFAEDSAISLELLADSLPLIRRRIAEENVYRIDKFGPEDPRTLSWHYIHSLLHLNLPITSITSSEQLQHMKSIPLESGPSSSKKAQILDEPTEALLQTLSPSGMLQTHDQAISNVPRRATSTGIRSLETVSAAIQSNIYGAVLGKTLQQALQIWIDPKAAFNKVAESFVAGLPIPIHIGYANVVRIRNAELGLTLLHLAKRRTEGQRTIYRVWVLMMYAELVKEDYESMRREVHDILSGLEDNPITRLFVYVNVFFLVRLFSSQGRKTEIPKLIDDLLCRATDSQSRATRHKRQKFFWVLAHKTRIWREMEIKWLSIVAAELYDIKMVQDAERVYAYVCTCAKAHYGKQAPATLSFQLAYLLALKENMRFAQMEKISSEILEAQSFKELDEFERYLARYISAETACRLEKFTSASETLQTLLKDLEPRENKSWEYRYVEDEELAIHVRVLLLEALGGSTHPDRKDDLRKDLLGRCLEHLNHTPREEFSHLWRDDTVWRCCAVSDEVYGVNHQVTWRLENYLPYADSTPDRVFYSSFLPRYNYGKCSEYGGRGKK
ncbi:hypothetical protein GGS24DRAFT_479628 [Hypoxylon argillaceum]|nr:hypothetical protein GGS24DRAFT_479628 [Hypoxylon argillaceum]